MGVGGRGLRPGETADLTIGSYLFQARLPAVTAQPQGNSRLHAEREREGSQNVHSLALLFWHWILCIAGPYFLPARAVHWKFSSHHLGIFLWAVVWEGGFIPTTNISGPVAIPACVSYPARFPSIALRQGGGGGTSKVQASYRQIICSFKHLLQNLKM